MALNLMGHEEFSHPPKTQVWQATHLDPWASEKRLPYRERSFISFKWGGRVIEDFGFIATINGDFLQRNVYADFEDITTQSPQVLDGQYYWGTHYTTNTLNVVLATDEIEHRELEKFRRWFVPGIERELILAEHPNRAIMARIANVPSYSFYPLEKKIEYKLAGADVNTSTTLYRGSIEFQFIMDEPHWYAIKEILGTDYITGTDGDHVYRWKDANGEHVNMATLTTSTSNGTKDALKIIIEDGVPSALMGNDGNVLMGNDYMMAEVVARTHVGSSASGSDWGINNPLTAIIGAGPYATQAGRVGIIDPIKDIKTTGFILGQGTKQAFYYPGTTYSYPNLKFTIVPTFYNSYIANPSNNFVNDLAPSTYTHPYNIITIECTAKKELHLTTPSIWTAYNRAVQLFSNSDLNGTAWSEMRIIIRDNVFHPAVRAWLNKIIDLCSVSTENGNSVSLIYNAARFREQILLALKGLFQDYSNAFTYPATFEFNCKTGEALGTFTYNVMSGTPTAFFDFMQPNTKVVSKTVVENVGDMVVSNFFRIEERNNPNADGYIVQWGWPHYNYIANSTSLNYSSPRNPYSEESKLYSHLLYHDFNTDLTNVHFTYKYMYL